MSSSAITLPPSFEAELVQRLYHREEAAMRVFDERYAAGGGDNLVYLLRCRTCCRNTSGGAVGSFTYR